MKSWNAKHGEGFSQYEVSKVEYFRLTGYESVREANREERWAEQNGPSAGNVGVSISERRNGRALLFRFTW
jgi:hypothetical protein